MSTSVGRAEDDEKVEAYTVKGDFQYRPAPSRLSGKDGSLEKWSTVVNFYLYAPHRPLLAFLKGLRRPEWLSSMSVEQVHVNASSRRRMRRDRGVHSIHPWLSYQLKQSKAPSAAYPGREGPA
jgi:hypothetical protein